MKYFIPTLILALAACQTTTNNGPHNSGMDTLTVQERRDMLIESNRHRVQMESGQIGAYLDTSEFEWISTERGIHYRIVDRGQDALIEAEDIIEYKYELRLLNDELIESSGKENAFIRVNMDNDAVLGLHQVMLNLHRGDSAIVIIPSDLAWGIAGNSEGIPPLSSVLYYLRIQE